PRTPPPPRKPAGAKRRSRPGGEGPRTPPAIRRTPAVLRSDERTEGDGQCEPGGPRAQDGADRPSDRRRGARPRGRGVRPAAGPGCRGTRAPPALRRGAGSERPAGGGARGTRSRAFRLAGQRRTPRSGDAPPPEPVTFGRRRWRHVSAALAVLFLLPGSAGFSATGGQIRLEEVSGASGIDYRNVSGEPEKRFIVSSLGAGAGLLDYDQDGDLDLYLVNGAPLEDRTTGPGLPNRLFRNEGGFRFSDQTEAAGVGDTGWGYGVAAADVDNDGFPDLYVTNLGENVLYRNRGDGTFERVRAAGGASHPGYSTSAAFLDAEGDGDLDLVVLGYTEDSIESLPLPGAAANCVWFGLPVFCGPSGLIPAEDGFFRNRGDGTFEDFTTGSGIAAAEAGYGLGVVAGDLDADGDADLYVANDSVPNHLFVNDGQGRFTEQALLSGTAYNVDGLAQAGMGVDAGDFDEDGQLDLFVTNFSHDTNTAYRNAGSGFFEDSTTRNELRMPGWFYLGWGTRFIDLDADGWLDLFVANGHVYPDAEAAGSGTRYLMKNQIFRNQGGGTFLEDEWDGPERSSRGVAFGDLDGDALPDLVVVNIDEEAALFRNASGGRGVTLQPVGTRAPRDGTGARVAFSTGDGVRRLREAHRSGSFLSSNDPRVHLGAGDGETILDVVVRWPGGAAERLGNLTADGRVIAVREGAGVVAVLR
ncbi:MAG: CRTAC1 family protein, partial [Acidobacteria bacterium]|nr:CRTAC1 family protein [Acidobacteriota bacterium]